MIKKISRRNYSVEFVDDKKKKIMLKGDLYGSILLVKWGITEIKFIFTKDYKSFTFGNLTYEKIELEKETLKN